MADDLDLLTLTEAHDAINLDASDTTHDDELARVVTAISRRVDQLCGPVVARTVADESHEAGTTILLREWPVLSVTTVTAYSGTTPTTLTLEDFPDVTDDDYRIDLGTGELSRWGSGNHRRFCGRVVVTYEAGRYASTATVDPLFKEAASAMLRRWWSREAGMWAQNVNTLAALDTQGDFVAGFFRVVDPIAKEMLADVMKAPSVG